MLSAEYVGFSARIHCPAIFFFFFFFFFFLSILICCFQCGVANEDAKFCEGCGAKLEGSAEASPEPVKKEEKKAVSPAPSKKAAAEPAKKSVSPAAPKKELSAKDAAKAAAAPKSPRTQQQQQQPAKSPRVDPAAAKAQARTFIDKAADQKKKPVGRKIDNSERCPLCQGDIAEKRRKDHCVGQGLAQGLLCSAGWRK
jgi:hypothetical protein